MTFAPSPDNIILGKGELFFDRFVGSASSGSYFHLGNCSRFAIVTEDDVIEINSSMDAAAGLIKRVTRSRRVTLQITSNEHGIENLALALMGDPVAGGLTQTSSAIAGEILTTSVVKGRFYKTAGRSITAPVITQGTVTWTQTTDYVLYDAGAGIIQVKATTGTAVTTATTATISYTRASLALDTVLGATKTKIEGKLLFVPDPTTGPQFDVEVYHVGVQPDGEVGLVSTEFGEYGLNMAVFDDSAGTYGGQSTNPFYRLIQRGTA